MSYKSIANLAVTGQALSVVAASMPKKGKKQNIVKTGMNTIIGTSLLIPTAQNVGSL